MKNKIIVALFLCLLTTSCKEDAKNSVATPQLNIENLEKAGEAGKVIFSKDNNAILIFDLLENTGKIKIDGKEIALNQLTFTENIYQIEGENISIVAENGDFQDMTTECIEGSFPKITITYNGQTLDIQDIKTKECPEHHNIID